jgi:hypothetical protein
VDRGDRIRHLGAHQIQSHIGYESEATRPS